MRISARLSSVGVKAVLKEWDEMADLRRIDTTTLSHKCFSELICVAKKHTICTLRTICFDQIVGEAATCATLSVNECFNNFLFHVPPLFHATSVSCPTYVVGIGLSGSAVVSRENVPHIPWELDIIVDYAKVWFEGVEMLTSLVFSKYELFIGPR